MAGALSALKCLSRAHTDRFLFGQILSLEYEKKRKKFHPLRLPLLGLTWWEAFRICRRVALATTSQLPRQLSACSLKLSQTEMRLQGFIGGSRQRHTREQRDRRQCRQLYRRKGRRKTHRQTHTGRQHRTGGRDPLSLPILWNKGHLTEWRPPFPRFGLRRGGLLPAELAAFQHAHWPQPYAGWNGQSVPSWKGFPHARHIPAF